MLFNDEIFLSFSIFIRNLLFKIIGNLNVSLFFFFSFLLFSDGQLFISELPELSKFNFIILSLFFFFLFSIYLISSTLFNCSFHFSFAAFFFFKNCSSFIFSLSNLFVENFLLLISDHHELLNLSVYQCLFNCLFLFESLFLLGLLKMIKSFFFLTMLDDFLIFFFLLHCLFSLNSKELLVCQFKFFSCLLNSSFSLYFFLFFFFEFFFYLLLDKFSL